MYTRCAPEPSEDRLQAAQVSPGNPEGVPVYGAERIRTGATALRGRDRLVLAIFEDRWKALEAL
jgi:hypothetical protein